MTKVRSERAAPQPLFDPEGIPLDPAFAGPAIRGERVELDRLKPDALRRRFLEPPVWSPELKSDARLFRIDETPRAAAVLVPLIARARQVSVLLTERTAHLADHAGQISFPGGGVEAGDADAVATALREAREEIGLASSSLEVLGTLPPYLTATGYQVTPVVALVEPPIELRLDEFEVAEAFEVPLSFVADPANHERRLVRIGEISRTFYAMPFVAQRRYFIWGATAAMLRNFYHFLRA
jgi:8-oxo-dGTP pyrophosphatase MutT (NUDIX family)